LAVVPGTDNLAYVSADDAVIAWNYRTGEMTRITGSGAASGAALFADAKYLYVIPTSGVPLVIRVGDWALVSRGQNDFPGILVDQMSMLF
jgi:hypothetical protein